ncbi:mucin-5AC isoform X2 [Musca domestica]|uniref:Mucin-5AC isoform X2 n=1 Tax=Musca domestica TaxID=7370 RepID=A0A9J7DGA3_MUSDO|nr:mucin-5AC isoform X2 [Musca domestica]XP_058974318.1 mucin-5AC isoform X2 [Musca domestica]XP_058974319.1 mucin-5AC isoform X2 [Musca domestica]
MKSSKHTRQQYGNSDRKRSEKANKLDRKSSRGMVYENEELRLRTININAEVERGQSDIKRLRKENDHLRREIWSLRDEYDRLNKRFKNKFIEAEQAARCSQAGCSCQCIEGGCDIVHSKCNSEDSDSCDSCSCQETDEIVCNGECCSEKKIMAANEAAEDPSPTDSTKLTVIDGMPVTPPQSAMPSILTGIDHLSVVSEETLSNSDVANVNPGNLLGYTPSISGSQTTLPSLVGPLTPLTPIELVANELNDIQAKVPPLSYFENVLQQHMNTNLTSSSGTSSSKSGRTVIRHTNGWDYNLESPFLQKHYPVNSVSPLLQKRSTAQTLTTFVPTTTLTPPPPPPPAPPTLVIDNGKSITSNPTLKSSGEMPVIETVPITTMSVNGPCVAVPATGNASCLNSNSSSNQNITSSTSTSINGQEKPAKHFFAPIKPKLKLNTALANQRRQPPPPPPAAAAVAPQAPQVLAKPSSFTNAATTTGQQLKCEPPDIYVTNGLATPYKHPLKPSVQPPPVPQRITSMATSAQTDSANLESILNDIEAISEDILAIQLEKTRSRDNLETRSTENVCRTTVSQMQQGNKNSKPYRSEMNLLLSYDGDNPTIRPAVPNSSSNTTENATDNTGTTRRTRSLEREHTDSPSPRIPDPMQPFPDNRKYIGFERLNNAAIVGPPSAATSTVTVTTTLTPRLAVTGTQTSPTMATPMGHRTHLPLSPLVTNVNMPSLANAGAKPAPPTRQYPTPLNIKCAGIQRSSSVSYKTNAMHSPTGGSPILGGVHPNKSQLFSAIANAAVARRAQFRSQPTHMTRSLDTDCLLESPNEGAGDVINNVEEKEIIETTKRKPRRVSIVCGETTAETPGTPGEKPTPTVRTIQTQNSSTTSTSGSCSDLPTVMPNPALRNFKQTSHSTPNSPHSSRKHEGSPFSTPTQPPTISITPTSPLHQQHGRSVSTHGNGSPHHHQLQQQQHSHSNSYPNAVATMHNPQQQQLRKNSQDTIKASAAEIACAAANVVRSKCSRRHSEGTVSHSNQRSSGTSGGTNGGHHHGHHNHHHHQHSSSIVSTGHPHHSRHSHQDSNHETVGSCSDRNSNSLASSRESSASFSMRSTRRKLSVSSNTGGKIPWCGCWGNGCL